MQGIRIRLAAALAALAAFAPAAHPADLDGSPPEVGAAEARRLYDAANDYVSRTHEGDYSYAYLQFYWLRAQSNVDRAMRVYPDSPTAKALASGQLKLGPYALDYFRDRVLYRLSEKKNGAFDSVDCSIFLYMLDEKRADARRDLALESILEVMARQQRWGEVLAFPVLDAHKPLLLGTVFRIAARYDQKKMVEDLLLRTSPEAQIAAGFGPSMAEAEAFLGRTDAQMDAFLSKHTDAPSRLAALHGVVVREIQIRRMQALHVAIKDTISTVHYSILNLRHRNDVAAFAAHVLPGRADLTDPVLAVYRAALGRVPDGADSAEAHIAYMQFLADAGRFDALGEYPGRDGLARPLRRECALAAIRLEAEAGREEDARRMREAFASGGAADSDDAALAEFTGRSASTSDQLTVREKTFSDIGIDDPCVLVRAIGEWVLSPNRTQRGAPPWDAVVYRYAKGFDHLPPPASAAVRDAASTLKPY